MAKQTKKTTEQEPQDVQVLDEMPSGSGDGAMDGDVVPDGVTDVAIIHADRPHGQVIATSNELATLYASKRWVPQQGRSRIAFPAPQELVEPFLEKLMPLQDLGISLHVETTNPASVQEPGTDEMHTAYGRVLVEARIGPFDEVDHQKVVGFVYALDVGKPEVQVYYGRNAAACINLAIFRSDHYVKGDLLTGGDALIYATAERFVEHFGEDDRTFIQNVQRLQGTIWNEPKINETIGRLYRYVLTKGSFGSSTLNYAIKLLADPNSRYAIGEDGTTTAWNFFSALTQFVTDKAYVSVKAEKTLQIVEQVCGDLLEIRPEQSN